MKENPLKIAIRDCHGTVYHRPMDIGLFILDTTQCGVRLVSWGSFDLTTHKIYPHQTLCPKCFNLADRMQYAISY
jgi:hypothetical protein